MQKQLQTLITMLTKQW